MLCRFLACLLACSVPNSATAADNAPDLGFDYQAMFKEHMKLVAEGKGSEAIDVLEKNTPTTNTFKPEFRDALKKKLAVIYGNAGKVVDHEVVGYKRLSSRIYRFTAVTHFELSAVTYQFTLFKTVSGDWKLSTYTVMDGVDELEKLTPFTPIRKSQD